MCNHKFLKYNVAVVKTLDFLLFEVLNAIRALAQSLQMSVLIALVSSMTCYYFV